MQTPATAKRGGSMRVIAALAFGAYAAFSFSWASDPLVLSLPMIAQGLLYLAVAAALLGRAPWASWFAVGIATGGLVVDALFPLTIGRLPVSILHAFDTLAQGGLLGLSWLVLTQARADADAETAPDRLTDASPSRIGWTFALAAGALPALCMAAVAPQPPAQGYCLSGPYVVPFGGELGWLPLAPFAALLALRLLKRVRTVGWLALLVSAVGGTALLLGSWQDVALETWHITGVWWPAHAMSLIGQLMLVAALVPLAAPVLRSLARR